jgi:hypothetical protein
LKTFVALAPIVKIKNVTSQIANDAKYIETLRLLGNEHLSMASSGNIITGSIVKSGISGIPEKILRLYSDERPELLDEKGFDNYLKFYPAGASF